MENILKDPYWTSRKTVITSEMNNTVDWFKGRLDSVEEKNSDFEARALEPIQTKIEKRITHTKIKISVICGTSSSHLTYMYLESLKDEGEQEKYEEIMVKKFPDLMKSVILQIQEAQLTPAKDV